MNLRRTCLYFDSHSTTCAAEYTRKASITMSKIINRFMGGPIAPGSGNRFNTSSATFLNGQHVTTLASGSGSGSAMLPPPPLNTNTPDNSATKEQQAKASRAKLTEAELLREQKLHEPRPVGYVNVAEWNPYHLGDWLKGTYFVNCFAGGVVLYSVAFKD